MQLFINDLNKITDNQYDFKLETSSVYDNKLHWTGNQEWTFSTSDYYLAKCLGIQQNTTYSSYMDSSQTHHMKFPGPIYLQFMRAIYIECDDSNANNFIINGTRKRLILKDTFDSYPGDKVILQSKYDAEVQLFKLNKGLTFKITDENFYPFQLKKPFQIILQIYTSRKYLEKIEKQIQQDLELQQSLKDQEALVKQQEEDENNTKKLIAERNQENFNQTINKIGEVNKQYLQTDQNIQDLINQIQELEPDYFLQKDSMYQQQMEKVFKTHKSYEDLVSDVYSKYEKQKEIENEDFQYIFSTIGVYDLLMNKEQNALINILKFKRLQLKSNQLQEPIEPIKPLKQTTQPLEQQLTKIQDLKQLLINKISNQDIADEIQKIKFDYPEDVRENLNEIQKVLTSDSTDKKQQLDQLIKTLQLINPNLKLDEIKDQLDVLPQIKNLIQMDNTTNAIKELQQVLSGMGQEISQKQRDQINYLISQIKIPLNTNMQNLIKALSGNWNDVFANFISNQKDLQQIFQQQIEALTDGSNAAINNLVLDLQGQLQQIKGPEKSFFQKLYSKITRQQQPAEQQQLLQGPQPEQQNQQPLPLTSNQQPLPLTQPSDTNNLLRQIINLMLFLDKKSQYVKARDYITQHYQQMNDQIRDLKKFFSYKSTDPVDTEANLDQLNQIQTFISNFTPDNYNNFIQSMYDKINEDQSSGNLHSGDDLFNKILGYAMQINDLYNDYGLSYVPSNQLMDLTRSSINGDPSQLTQQQLQQVADQISNNYKFIRNMLNQSNLSPEQIYQVYQVANVLSDDIRQIRDYITDEQKQKFQDFIDQINDFIQTNADVIEQINNTSNALKQVENQQNAQILYPILMQQRNQQFKNITDVPNLLNEIQTYLSDNRKLILPFTQIELLPDNYLTHGFQEVMLKDGRNQLIQPISRKIFSKQIRQTGYPLLDYIYGHIENNHFVPYEERGPQNKSQKPAIYISIPRYVNQKDSSGNIYSVQKPGILMKHLLQAINDGQYEKQIWLN